MGLQVRADFAGGNIVVDRITDSQVYVHQDLRDTPRDWFYWCFEVEGAAGTVVDFHFTESRALGVRGPAYSYDGGRRWQWLHAGDMAGNTFQFTFPAEAPAVRFSFGMPYLEEHWKQFLSGIKGRKGVEAGVLCMSQQGREVELLRLGCLDKEPKHRVVLTCRHHCCEMMANYALEGLIDAVLKGDAEQTQRLGEQVEFLIVPFVDKDGVEQGDQGKERQPHDHNRDYSGAIDEGLYASTRALRGFLERWSDGRLAVVLDLHCPWICGKHSEEIYLVGAADADIEQAQRRFNVILEESCQDGLPFAAVDFLPYGMDWNVAANFQKGKSFAAWAGELPGVCLASSLELPYANARGVEVTAESARLFGRDLAMALGRYVQEL